MKHPDPHRLDVPPRVNADGRCGRGRKEENHRARGHWPDKTRHRAHPGGSYHDPAPAGSGTRCRRSDAHRKACGRPKDRNNR